MRKTITKLVLALLLASVLFTGLVSAENINATLKTNIKTKKVEERHKLIKGESPTTGLPTENKDYVPILLQIDNNRAAIPQWGIGSADIIYELPIQGREFTRLTALFVDSVPNEAGPVRSGRVLHVDLREEWDAMWFFFGSQDVDGSSVRALLSKYKVTKKGLAVNGIGNKFEKKYFPKSKYHPAPHDRSAQLKALYDYTKSLNYKFKERPFLFTDELPSIGKAANQILVKHGKNVDTAAAYLYNAETKKYIRYTFAGPYTDLLNPDSPIEYSNIIIQRTKLSFNNAANKPLFKEVVGKGAADIFIGGKYIKGAWERKSIKSRTVFFDSNGDEIKLQRGKTWITMCDTSTDVSYFENPIDTTDFFKNGSTRKKISKTVANVGTNKNNQQTETNEETSRDNKLENAQSSNTSVGNLIERFKPQKPGKSPMLEFYTELKVPGVDIPVFCFTNNEGTVEFRTYGKMDNNKKAGFYPISLNLVSEEGDDEQRFEVSLLSNVMSKDRKRLATFKGVVINKDDVPEGLKKVNTNGVYSFTNLFGKKETVAYAKFGNSDPAWYFSSGRAPKHGSIKLNLENVLKFKKTDTVYKQTAEFRKGHAIEVEIPCSNNKTAKLWTNLPMIDFDKLTAK